MKGFPFICDNPECRTIVFRDDIIGARGTIGLTVKSSRVIGGCRNCGSDLKSIDAEYQFIESEIAHFGLLDTAWNMDLRPSDISSLYAVLKSAKANQLSQSATADAIRKKVPGAEPLARAVESSPKASWGQFFDRLLLLVGVLFQITGPIDFSDLNARRNDQVIVQPAEMHGVEAPAPEEVPEPKNEKGTPEPGNSPVE